MKVWILKCEDVRYSDDIIGVFSNEDEVNEKYEELVDRVRLISGIGDRTHNPFSIDGPYELNKLTYLPRGF